MNEQLDALEAEAAKQESWLAELVRDTAALLERSRAAHVEAARHRARLEAAADRFPREVEATE